MGWRGGICGFAAMGAVACGLEQNGLLADDDAAVPIEGGAGDDASADAIAPGDDAQSGADSTTGGKDAGGDVDFDAPPPPPADASPAPVVWDGGPIDNPDFTDQDWIGFCVGLAGCGQMDTISHCLGRMPQPSSRNALFPTPTMIQCVANAGPDCTAVGACLGDGSKCTSADACVGGSWVSCSWGFKMTFPCADEGMVCSSGSGNPGCGFGDCFAWQQGQTTCAGPHLVECDHGRYASVVDCQGFGVPCGGSPAHCLLTSSNACLDVSCSQLFQNGGFQCSVDDAGAPVCALGNQCNPAHQDTCDPSQHQAQFCNAGVPSQFDCKTANWQNNCASGRCTNN